MGTSGSPINPQVGALAANGGPTLTHALLGGSPAIDTGNPAAPGSGGNACESTDQRGYLRPADGDTNGSALCDIGALEAGATPPAGGTTTFTYDNANRLINVNGVAYTWDNNGNLLSNGVFTYTYDFANRLSMLKQGTSLTYTYTYR